VPAEVYEDAPQVFSKPGRDAPKLRAVPDQPASTRTSTRSTAAGGALGWAAFAWIGVNERRGTIVSIIIGAVGGFIGGQMLAPLMGSTPIVSGDFNIQALFIAAISASACLAIGNMIEKRFGV